MHILAAFSMSALKIRRRAARDGLSKEESSLCWTMNLFVVIEAMDIYLNYFRIVKFYEPMSEGGYLSGDLQDWGSD